MTLGRRKHWRVRLAFEPNRYASEQLQKAYEQLTPIEARSTVRPAGARPERVKQLAMKRGER